MQTQLNTHTMTVVTTAVRLMLTTVLLLCFAALLQAFVAPGVQSQDVVRVIVGMCGTYGVCYLWAPRATARAVRFFTE